MTLADYLKLVPIGEFARRTGLTRQTLGNVLYGRTRPSAGTIEAIVDATDGEVSAEELLECGEER